MARVMAQFAVYQSGGPVYGVGETTNDAIIDARKWLERSNQTIAVLSQSAPCGEIDGDLYCRPCSLELAASVAADGGDIRYHEINGILNVDTE